MKSQTPKAYLMTREEYLSSVVPILTEYKKFLRKNKQFFVSGEYGGMFWVSFLEIKEAVEKGIDLGSYRLNFAKEYHYSTSHNMEWRVDETWNRMTEGMSDMSKDVPVEVNDKNKEYRKQLTAIFDDRFFKVMLENSDNTKSNKRAIKYALESGLYEKLIKENQVEISNLEKYAASADVKLPNRLYDENILAMQKIKQKVYENIQPTNKDVLEGFVNFILKSFKPLEDRIYNRNNDRYNKLINEALRKPEVRDDSCIIDNIPVFWSIFSIGKKTDLVIHCADAKGRTKTKTVKILTEISLRQGWDKILHDYIMGGIEQLRWKFIGAIVSNFKFINIPIESIQQLELKVSVKGFEGEYRFNFENGSRFDFKTEAISAGGYNIQRYHFRYLSNFNNAVLADGTKITGSFNAIDHFSDKKKQESEFDPYLGTEAANSIEEIIEILYRFFLRKSMLYHNFKNVRKNIGSKECSVSFKEYNSTRYGSSAIYLKQDMDLPEAKQKVYSILENMKINKTTETV